MKKKFYLLILFVSIGIVGNARTRSNHLNILPTPQKMEIGRGLNIDYSDVKYIVVDETIKMPVLGDFLGILPQQKIEGKLGVQLKITQQDVPKSLEGYTLSISKSGVVISSRGRAGLFYGCQTLEQLLTDSRDFDKKLVQLFIEDFPAIAYRSVHFDTKHHLSDINYYYDLIDKLSSYKINGIIWELEDKLRYTRRPEIGTSNAISKQQMQALCRYANDRNIDVSPLVQGLGHASFILKHHKNLREDPNSDWVFCPSEPLTYELQFDMYLDALEAQPYGKYLHVGGDEIGGLGKDERCKESGKSPFELQMMWFNKVCDFAIKHNRIPIFWDDMPLKNAGLWGMLQKDMSEEEMKKQWNTSKLDASINLFPRDGVYMRWNYGDPTHRPHMKLLEWYASKGLKVMAATAAASGGSPFLPRYDSHAHYIKAFSELVAKDGLEGILATSWDDGSPHWETVVRGFIAQGEYGWNPTARSVDEFKTVHAQREFGFKAEDQRLLFIDSIAISAFFFDNAFITKGRRNPAWQTRAFTLMDMPDKKNPGVWSEKYKEKIVEAKQSLVRNKQVFQDVTEAIKLARRNRYTLEVYQQTANLIDFPVGVILALYEYDQADSDNARTTALENIRKVCQEFDTMRKKLEEVYSKTRFMEQPEGFIPDLNHHAHLSALSLNSDWLYWYELPMLKKIEVWLK